jgi:hypothetical protein
MTWQIIRLLNYEEDVRFDKLVMIILKYYLVFLLLLRETTEIIKNQVSLPRIGMIISHYTSGPEDGVLNRNLDRLHFVAS